MATIKLYLDTRGCVKGNPAPVKIALTKKGSTVTHSTGVKLLPEQWDKEACKVIKHPQKLPLNNMLATLQSEWQLALVKLESEGKARRARSAAELKKMIRNTIDPQEGQQGNFVAHYKKYAATRRTPGTRDTYWQTLRRMEAFDKNLETRTFEDIDKHWLTGFEAFMEQTTHSENSRAFHYRNIRAVFNDAIDEEITTSYPFRKFKIRRAPTPKRSLTVEQLRTLATYPCEPHLVAYRDIFMLMFFLAGINAVDLFAARRANLVNGRLEYIRAKTHKLYSIKIEPEAAELIEKYKGKNYLLFVSDNCSNYKNYLHRLGVALKNIGPVKRVGRGGKKVREPLFPNISQYWCRHSWATIAASLDIPKETIAAGLGHGGNTVTDIYIDFDRRKVDEANRRVMDWVIYGKK